MDFPYGKAALLILLGSLLSALWLTTLDHSPRGDRKPDIVFATFTKEHARAYRPAIARFEKENNVRIQLQVVNDRALQSRLQSALQVGADVPDMVELMDGTMGIFTKGPIQDVGFVDL